MKLNCKIGDIIHSVDVRNTNLQCDNLLGLSMTKEFRPSTSNIVGTDLSKYKIVGFNHFAVDFMSAIRVHKMPIALNQTGKDIIVSPAYGVFAVNDENVVLPEFLMLWFRRPDFDRYADFKSDSAIRGGYDWNELCETDIDLPPISEQRKIVHDYQVITDRIGLLRKMNENLEEQAQTIYKSWFETYDPFGGEMPLDWIETTIGDLSSDVICGKTPPTDHVENYGGQIPFITIPDMHGSVYVVNTERTLSEIGIATQSNKTLPENSICVSCIATVGLVCLTAESSQTNQQINSIVCKPDVSPFYVYLKMRTMEDHLKALGAGGSATLNVNKSLFSEIKILYPDKNTIKRFHEIVSPIFSTIRQYQLEMQRLYSLSMIMSNMQRIVS